MSFVAFGEETLLTGVQNGVDCSLHSRWKENDQGEGTPKK